MRSLRSIFALPSLGRRRVIAESLVDLRGNRTRARTKAGNHGEPHPSSYWEDIIMELTRRHALAGAAALAATPLLPAINANAAAPMADKQAPSFYRYKVGDIQVTVISDGVNTFALGDSFVLNAKKDE